MNKHRYNRVAFAIMWSLILVLCGAITTFAQEKQKIPAESFIGAHKKQQLEKLLEKLLDITEKHLLSEFSFENTRKYKSNLQQLLGEVLEKFPEYYHSNEFKKVLKVTDEYLQKEFSHEIELKYCRQLSKILFEILSPKWQGKITIKQDEKLGEVWDTRKVTVEIEFIQGKAKISAKSEVFHYHPPDPDHICTECLAGVPNPMTSEIPPITFSALLKFQDKDTLILESLDDDVGEFGLNFPLLMTVKYRDSNTIKIEEEQEIVVPSVVGIVVRVKVKITGELYQTEFIRKTFPNDIKPNEQIKTDKKTQLEITMPSKDVIKVAPNTAAVIRSESLMEVVKGKMHGLIKKLKPKTKFEIRTPTAIITVKGPTEYIVEVEDDGTTTVVVLDGEVEVSDKENKKTVIVKKNQKSVVKPGALPTEPEAIDPEKILNWWK